MKVIFDPAPWPAEQIVRLSYGDDDPSRQRLALYLPEGRSEGGWSTLVFVHGGGWTKGSIDLEAAGYPIYGNIGGLYARRGVAVALLEYRLQQDLDELSDKADPDGSPEPREPARSITWREQVLDVAQGVARLRQEVAARGGDASHIVLSGHSAGAQLAAYVAVADWPGQQVPGLGRVCGVVAISGAGYDLADTETYRLGASPAYYEARFHDALSGDGWRAAASVVQHLDPDDPPFRIFYAGREHVAIQHQAHLLDQALGRRGIEHSISEVPGQGHRRIVVTFSQGSHPMTQQTSAFIEEAVARCSAAR